MKPKKNLIPSFLYFPQALCILDQDRISPHQVTLIHFDLLISIRLFLSNYKLDLYCYPFSQLLSKISLSNMIFVLVSSLLFCIYLSCQIKWYDHHQSEIYSFVRLQNVHQHQGHPCLKNLCKPVHTPQYCRSNQTERQSNSSLNWILSKYYEQLRDSCGQFARVA